MLATTRTYTKGLLTSVTDPNGAVTTYGYDGLGRKTAVWLDGDGASDPNTATTTYGYQIGGATPNRVQIGRRKDAGGTSVGVRTFEYQFFDGVGRLIQRQIDFVRPPALGKLVRAQDVNDLCTAVGKYTSTPSFYPVVAGTTRILASHYVGLRNSVQTLWTSAGLGQVPNWTSGVTPGGPSLGTTPTHIYTTDLDDLRRWVNRYETATGRTASLFAGSATPAVIIVNRVYDGRGLLQKESVPHPISPTTGGAFSSGDWGSGSMPATTFAYDALSRTLTKTLPNGGLVDWSYSGWTTTSRDENRHQKAYTNDGLGRLVTVQEYTGNSAGSYAVASTTQYTYDVADQLTQVTDALGNQTKIGYDELGRKLKLHDPDLCGGTVDGQSGYWWTYAYDPVGTLTSQTDAKGQTLTFEYDTLKRLTAKKSGATTLAGYTYDETGGFFSGSKSVGRRTTMSFGASLADSAKSYYDSRGRVTKSEQSLGGAGHTTWMAYDDLDRVMTLTYPNGEVVTYGYGELELPFSLRSSARGVLVSSQTYNALGKPYDLTLGNGLVVSQRYYGLDSAESYPYGLLGSIVAGSQQSLTYQYDGKGNVTSVVDVNPYNAPGETLSYAYDHLDRLTGVSGAYGKSYGYDAVGRFVSFEGASYTYPDAGRARPHAPAVVGGSVYQYDANGNLISAEGRRYCSDRHRDCSQVLLARTYLGASDNIGD